jgi:hypothetical protein
MVGNVVHVRGVMMQKAKTYFEQVPVGFAKKMAAVDPLRHKAGPRVRIAKRTKAKRSY